MAMTNAEKIVLLITTLCGKGLVSAYSWTYSHGSC